MEDKEIKVLNLLPCYIGEEYLENARAAGLDDAEANQILALLMDQDYVTVLNNMFVLTEKGKKAMEEINKEMDVSTLETKAITKKAMKDVVWVGKKLTIHPAIFFDDSRCYTTQFLTFYSKNKQIDKPVIITSSREMFPYDALPEFLQVKPLPARPPRTYWSQESIESFLKGNDRKVSLKEAYETIFKEFDYYIEFPDPRYLIVLSLWVLGTYFYQLFSSYPYLFIFGTKQSGKSKICKLTSCLAFNARNFIAPSSASFFRIIHNFRPALIVDEAEKLDKKQKTELMSILLSGYSRGSTVPRSVERVFKTIKTIDQVEFEVYCPKMISNISGVEEVLEDRCIVITMQRPLDMVKSRRSLELEDIPKFQPHRDILFLNLMQNWRQIKAAHDALRKFFEGDAEVKCRLILQEFKEKLYARNFELWYPLITLAYALDDENILSQLQSICFDLIKEREMTDQTENFDNAIIMSLCQVVDKDGWYKLSELAEFMRNNSDVLEGISSKSVGTILKRLKLRYLSKMLNGRYYVYIKLDSLKQTARRFNINYEEIAEKKEILPEIISEKEAFIATVRDLCEKQGDFTIEQLQQALNPHKISFEKIEKFIENALKDGLIFEHKPGCYRLTPKGY